MIKKTDGDIEYILASFRDPSGFLFLQDSVLYRQVNTIYRSNYDDLMSSGLYDALVRANLLIPHQEVNVKYPQPECGYKVIKPELLPFISYPYEWCFSQLKDAALTTLKVQRKALEFGMSLKDCSVYNIQFRNAKPIFIDTLSFEKYCEGQPWLAYRQFCQHFLAPLALIAHKDSGLNQLLRVYIDGIPLDLASSLLPVSTRFNSSLQFHIHLHSKSQKHFADKVVNRKYQKLSRLGLLGIIDSLESAVKNLKWHPGGTEWSDYYGDTNYSPESFRHKKQLVAEYLDRVQPSSVLDIGSNIGTFSRIASDKGIFTVSIDNDSAAVEKNYLESVTRSETNILPLVVDIVNPSPGIGWANKERMPFIERGKVGVAMALALVHHLAISNSLPLGYIARLLANICSSLIIEFVPKTDSQVQRLLASREDIFPDYTQPAFEREFSRYFTIEDCASIRDSQRILYLMQR